MNHSEDRARDVVDTIWSDVVVTDDWKVIAFVVGSTVDSIFFPVVVSAVVSKVVFIVVSYVGSSVSKMVSDDGFMVVGMMLIVSSEAVSVVKDIIVC